MVSMLAASAVDRGFERRSGQTTEYKIIICCFSALHAALRRKSKIWLSWYQDNVSEWGYMSIREPLVWYRTDLIVISLKINLFLP